MLAFGNIVLTRFPFTDLTGSKVRPARVVSRDATGPDVILAFITSKVPSPLPPHSIAIQPSSRNGLKVPSLIRLDKLATLEQRVVVGQIGITEAAFLKSAAPNSLMYLDFRCPNPTSDTRRVL